MYVAVFIVGIILIFPFIVSLYFYFDKEYRKLYFAVYLFGKLRILSGYLKIRDRKSVYIHVSDKKAIVVDLSVFKKMQDGPNFIKAINLDLFDMCIDSGTNNVNLVFILLLLYKVFSGISPILQDDYGINGKFNLYFYNENFTLKSVKIKIRIQFNLICILISLIANIISVGDNNDKGKGKCYKRRIAQIN